MKRSWRCSVAMVAALVTCGVLAGTLPPSPVQAQTAAAFDAELRRLYDDDSQFERLSGAARSRLEHQDGFFQFSIPDDSLSMVPMARCTKRSMAARR